MIEKISLADYKKMLWKNGQGFTLEIARGTVANSDDLSENLDDFSWRISMADVTTSGAFSNFSGKQRILSVLSGAGVALKIDDKPMVTLHRQDTVHFYGASQVASTLLDGAIRDLNVIFDPKMVQAQMSWVNEPSQLTLKNTDDTMFILTIAESLRINIGNRVFNLSKYDCIKMSGNSVVEVTLPPEAINKCCVIKIVKGKL